MRLLLAPKVRASGGGAKDQAFHAPENAQSHGPGFARIFAGSLPLSDSAFSADI